MNFCAVYGCSNRSNREKEKSFHRLPAIITREGSEIEELSRERRLAWIAALRRKDLTIEGNLSHVRVCSDHFQSGKPVALYQRTHPLIGYPP